MTEAHVQIDLTNCDREPIHIPSAIQPHGMLLVLDPEWRIIQASANTLEFLDAPIDEVLGHDGRSLFGREAGEQLEAVGAMNNPTDANPFLLEMPADPRIPLMEAVTHRVEGMLVLELEPARDIAHDPAFSNPYAMSQLALDRLSVQGTLAELADQVAYEVRLITGYDRVMVYRFDRDWGGEVIAEHHRDHLYSFLGHHFPSSDIPVQARWLYRLNWTRLLADVHALQVPLVPADNPSSGGPLDMSRSALRSVSPVHLEYLRNMGVGATLTISIRGPDGDLWGLLLCHHLTPKHVSHHTRLVCELLGRVFSLQAGALKTFEGSLRATAVAWATVHLLSAIAEARTRFDMINTNAERLLALVDADGAVIRLNGETQVIGEAPAGAEVGVLLDLVSDEIVVSDELSALEPNTALRAPGVAGVLGVRGPPGVDEAIVFWRGEAPRVITWGGEPQAPNEADGSLSPRESFTAWTEVVLGHSREWDELEVAAATQLARELPTLLLPSQD